MKRKITAIAICVVEVLIAILAPYFLRNVRMEKRYHQHQSAKLRPEDEVDDGTFNTHLPLLCIDTNGNEIPGVPLRDEETGKIIRDEDGFTQYTLSEEGEKTILASMDVIDHIDQVNRPEDAPEITTDIRIRVRGRSSRHFDKSNYLVELIDEDGSNRDEPLLGMASHHSWALHGPFLDKTQLRNYMWYNIAGEIMDYAPNVRFCEVMIDGEYVGLYVLTEMITAGKNKSRLPLTVSKGRETYSGYLLRLDQTNEIDKTINSFTNYTMRRKNTLEIVFPGQESYTESMKESIRQDFSDFEKMLYSYDYDSSKFGYKKYIDTQSFVDYFILNEFTSNYDAGWLSTYIYKDIDGRFHMCIWDFNSACDNYNRPVQEEGQHFEFQNVLWYNMLLKDEDFTQSVINRYRDLRKKYLNEEYLEQYMDDVVAYLGPAIDRNFEVWGYTYDESEDILHPTERNPRTYEEAIDNMKEYIEVRGAWMDENIESLLQYSNESKIKKFNEEAN